MKKLKKYWKLALGALLVSIASVVFLQDFKSNAGASLIDGSEYHHELTIILDAAHGSDVAGKASPDGTHREYAWSRFWINQLGKHLTDIGFTVVYTAPEETEPGLTERVRRMNAVSGPAIVFSLHNNAAGCGEWKSARGWSLWTTKGVTRSDQCAEIIYINMLAFIPELPFRYDISDGDHDYEANFTVLMSKHPSVLLEYMFQDNKLDLELIENPALSLTILYILDVSFLQIERYLTTKKAA
ncbi:hypothetical protein SDC9_46852 [bioreactor metagenome]|uniref:MurNAc-LAA domain-containing protein n=1 Tax=bioreactor metagenome TaxID=1076179 RepID=A0A644W9X9_9ZZZZ